MLTFTPIQAAATRLSGTALRTGDRVHVEVEIRGLRVLPESGQWPILLPWPTANGGPLNIAIDANGDGELIVDYEAAPHQPGEPGYEGAPVTVAPDPEAQLATAKVQAAEALRTAALKAALDDLVNTRVADPLAAIDAATSIDEVTSIAEKA